MSGKPWLFLGGLNGALAVGLGAYGWHGLAGDAAMRSIFMLAVNYHMWHALALVGVAALAERAPASRLLTLAGSLFTLGIILFSGSLYLFATLGAMPVSGAAPIGGAVWITAWAILAWVGYKRMRA